MGVAIAIIALLLIFALIVLASSVRILREYERGVIFRLGRLIAQKGPGLILLIPIIDRMVRVDLRTVTLTVPPQEVISKDNVTVRVNAVAYFRVIDPNRAITEVENFLVATSQISQTTLRSVLGKAELDALLSERERLNIELQQIIDEQTEPWGVKVSTVEVKDVELPQEMQRAIARQAEAERERRAKIIAADGEFQAAEKLSQAAEIFSRNPATLQLRYLQTLIDIGVNQNSTIVFPLPIDMLKRLRRSAKRGRWRGRERASGLEAAERARDPHRPAHRAAGDPRPRAGGAARRLRPGPSGHQGRRGRDVPVLRGPRGPYAARGLGAAARRRDARLARMDPAGGAEPVPGARRGRRRVAACRPRVGWWVRGRAGELRRSAACLQPIG